MRPTNMRRRTRRALGRDAASFELDDSPLQDMLSGIGYMADHRNTPKKMTTGQASSKTLVIVWELTP